MRIALVHFVLAKIQICQLSDNNYLDALITNKFCLQLTPMFLIGIEFITSAIKYFLNINISL
jgi:hypothetical protein